MIDPADRELMSAVQRETLRFFWEFAHPVSGLSRDRTNPANDPANDMISIGGTGFGLMAIIVGVERGWIERAAAVRHILKMERFLLTTAASYHGVLPHFLNGTTGVTIPLSRKDDGADLVETAYLVMGLLCCRQYFDREDEEERLLRSQADTLWHEVEWSWHRPPGLNVLLWHWSPNNGWSMNFELRGWNECLVTYILAAGSPTYPVDPIVYHEGWAQSRRFTNGKSYYDVELPLGPDFAGPLFFAHYTFLGIDPRGLTDRYADYWQQNVAHAEICYRHCVRNPNGWKGYGPDCWGLTASDSDAPSRYEAHAPDNDRGVISPTAALASMPYTPEASMRALRHFHGPLRHLAWGEYGPNDAFNETHGWASGSHLAIDQGPIILMIENHLSGLLWRLFMSCPEVRQGLERLGFRSAAYRSDPAA